MGKCIFCDIGQGKTKSDFIYRDQDVSVFKDINPRKPIHWLVVPNRHITSLNDLTAADEALVGKLFTTVKKVAQEHGFAQNGYRIVINTNKHGGQVVDHLHLHILAGDHVGRMCD